MKNCRDEKEIPVCRIISHPISLMTADPKELFGMAFLRWIGGRREPMKNRRYNKLAAGSSALIPVLIWVINQIKELGLHEHQVNRTKHHKNCRFLSKSRLISLPTLYLLFQLLFLPNPTQVG
jgi:hypothetical protein